MENPQDRAIVNAIIGMAHAMDMEVLAEGVERTDQLAYLLDKGCDRAQGYHFGKPVPAEEFQAMVVAQQAARRGVAVDGQGQAALAGSRWPGRLHPGSR